MKSAIVVSVEPDVQPLGLGGDFETNARFLSELGFDGAEVSIMNAASVPAKWVREIAKRYGLAIPALGAGRYFLKHGLFFTSKDKGVRARAVQAVQECTRLAGELGSHFIVGPVQGNSEKGDREAFQQARDCLGACAKTAEKEGALLLVEPINRFSTAFIRTIAQGVKMVEEVNSPSLKLLVDTFHMNIEERSMTQSIKEGGRNIAHVHFSDSNRLAPGQGHIDFRAVAEALREIGYQGFASGEIQPEPDQESAARWTVELIKSLHY